MLTFAKKSPDLINYLKTRRSVTAKNMTGPGPSLEQLKEILEIGARVPDHGKLSPFYFITLQGEQRREAGQILRKAYLLEEEDASTAKLDLEAERFMRAPTIVIAVSRPRASKVPVWEQVLSAGAACQNIVLASNGLGFCAQWLTEWYTYNDAFKESMGLDLGHDHIAGVIYIGTATKDPEERDRPNIEDLTNQYDLKATSLKKGDSYARKGDLKLGFDFKLDQNM